MVHDNDKAFQSKTLPVILLIEHTKMRKSIKFESTANNLSRDFVDYRYIYHVDEILSSTEYNDFINELIQPIFIISSGYAPLSNKYDLYKNEFVNVDPVENEYIDDWLTDDVYWSNEDWN